MHNIDYMHMYVQKNDLACLFLNNEAKNLGYIWLDCKVGKGKTDCHQTEKKMFFVSSL